jgi:hypothetical protein
VDTGVVLVRTAVSLVGIGDGRVPPAPALETADIAKMAETRLKRMFIVFIEINGGS